MNLLVMQLQEENVSYAHFISYHASLLNESNFEQIYSRSISTRPVSIISNSVAVSFFLFSTFFSCAILNSF